MTMRSEGPLVVAGLIALTFLALVILGYVQ